MQEGNGNQPNNNKRRKVVADHLVRHCSRTTIKFYEEVDESYRAGRAWSAEFVKEHADAGNFLDDTGRSFSVPVVKYHELLCDLTKYALDVQPVLDRAIALLDSIPDVCPEDDADDGAFGTKDTDSYEKSVKEFKRELKRLFEGFDVTSRAHTRGLLLPRQQ